MIVDGPADFALARHQLVAMDLLVADVASLQSAAAARRLE
jgi:hypothetical protein